MKLGRKVISVFDKTSGGAAFFAASLLVVIMITVFISVVMRYFLGESIPWVIGYCEVGLVYITFFAAAWVLKREGHVKVDLILSRLGPKSQSSLGILSSTVGAIICLPIVWFGAQVAWDYFRCGWYYTEFYDIPAAPVVVAIPVGFLLLFFQLCRRVRGYLNDWRSLKRKQFLKEGCAN